MVLIFVLFFFTIFLFFLTEATEMWREREQDKPALWGSSPYEQSGKLFIQICLSFLLFDAGYESGFIPVKLTL